MIDRARDPAFAAPVYIARRRSLRFAARALMRAHIGPMNASDSLNTQADDFDVLAFFVVEPEGLIVHAVEIGPQVRHRRVTGQTNWDRYQNLMSLTDVMNIGAAFQQDIVAGYTFSANLLAAQPFEVAPAALEILNRCH